MCQLHCVKEITIGRKTGGVMKIGVRPLPVRQQQQQWRTLALLGSQLSSSRPSTVGMTVKRGPIDTPLFLSWSGLEFLGMQPVCLHLDKRHSPGAPHTSLATRQTPAAARLKPSAALRHAWLAPHTHKPCLDP